MAQQQRQQHLSAPWLCKLLRGLLEGKYDSAEGVADASKAFYDLRDAGYSGSKGPVTVHVDGWREDLAEATEAGALAVSAFYGRREEHLLLLDIGTFIDGIPAPRERPEAVRAFMRLHEDMGRAFQAQQQRELDKFYFVVSIVLTSVDTLAAQYGVKIDRGILDTLESRLEDMFPEEAARLDAELAAEATAHLDAELAAEAASRE